MTNFENMVVPLQFQADPAMQKLIIEHVRKRNLISEGEGNLIDPFWLADSVRDFNSEQFVDLTEHQRGRMRYLLRLLRTVQWHWQDHLLTPIIQNILKPLESAIIKLNRVAIIIEIPGKDVPAHRDLVVGENYQNMASETSTFLGSEYLRYKGDPWFQEKFVPLPDLNLHQKQNYYGLRIPLSEKTEDNGRSFIRSHGGEKHYYNTRNHLFLLDEASMEHGADSVDFHRGVVIVDAELNLNEILKHRI